MGNFESYTFKITSTPYSTQNQKPVSLRAINKSSDPSFICPVVTYNDVYTNAAYICVAYTLNFDLSTDASQSYQAAGTYSTLLTANAATNFDIEAGTKSGKYCWMNCLTAYDGSGAPKVLNSLALRLAAIDVDSGSGPFTVEYTEATPTFSTITPARYMFTTMWKYGIFFAALSSATSLTNPATKNLSYSASAIPDTFGTMALGSSTITGWLGITPGTHGSTVELETPPTRTGTNPREVIANFEEVLVVDNVPTSPSIIVNRITGSASPSISNSATTLTPAGSYFKMLAIFQHNATLVIVGQTGSGLATFDLLVINISGTPTITHQRTINAISSDTGIDRPAIRILYVGGYHTTASSSRTQGTVVGIVVNDNTSMRLYVCDWTLGGSGTLSVAHAIAGAGKDIQQVECAAVQAISSNISYVMMYRNTAVTINFVYIDSTLQTWSAISVYESPNANFSWAKSSDDQSFITISQPYSLTQDFVIHRYSFGSAAGNFPMLIS